MPYGSTAQLWPPSAPFIEQVRREPSLRANAPLHRVPDPSLTFRPTVFNGVHAQSSGPVSVVTYISRVSGSCVSGGAERSTWAGGETWTPTRTGGGGSLQAWHRSSGTGQRPVLSLRSGLPASLGAKSIRIKGKHPASGRDQGPGLVRRG
ncbi:unnamed protein product [Boreogadus saida]